jgi:acetyl esterase/lipase
VILPNYRLLPESSGADILSDLSDFWSWFNKRSVDAFLSSKGHELDLNYDKIIVSGDSAGGYMALMSALTQKEGSIKAVLAQYPMTNYLRCTPSETFMGRPSPPESALDHHLAAIKPGTVVSSAFPPERINISYPMAAYGRYLDFFGKDETMWPIGKVEEEGKKLPPTWIVHGSKDTAVAMDDSRAFVEKCGRLGVGEVRLCEREGMEHGFDIEMKEDEEEWLKEGVAWLQGKWLC